METTNTATVARTYADALTAKDFGTVAGMFADDIVWHQPGSHKLSGTYRGSAAVGELLGAMMAATQGTFELAVQGAPMINGDVAAMQVHFAAERDGAELSMAGVDMVRIDGDRVAEVWLFSADQQGEDEFWGAAEA